MEDEAPAVEEPAPDVSEGEELLQPVDVIDDAIEEALSLNEIPTVQYPEEYGEEEGVEGEYGRVDYGEGGMFVFYGEGEGGYPIPWPGEYESSISGRSVVSSVGTEEPEEEKALRLLKESWVEKIKQKMADRQLLRRRNVFLQKKLVEHFKKRRMDHVLKEDTKGLDLETKYLRRLYAFQDFKHTQEDQIAELTENMVKFKEETNSIEEELNDTLNKFMQRQRDFSTGLILGKTGKKLNEKVVDRLVRRQIKLCEELGMHRLKYIKIKYLIEEKEVQLKAMENFGEGLHMMDYEQMKIDNQNLNDKIEEKEDELSKLRVKTQGNIQNLAHVREKDYAIGGDIELMEEKFYDIETQFNETRERVTKAKTKRDQLRGEYHNLKRQAGLLTRNRLLRDFEESIDEAELIADRLAKIKSTVETYRERDVGSKVVRAVSSFEEFKFPFEIEMERKGLSLVPNKVVTRSETDLLAEFLLNYESGSSLANGTSLISYES